MLAGTGDWTTDGEPDLASDEQWPNVAPSGR
jgi:hypothetical protein